MDKAARKATLEDLRSLPDDGSKHELIGGEIVMSPAGARHEWIVARLIALLSAHLSEGGRAHVFGPDLGCLMTGGNCLCPDVSVVMAGRLRDLGGIPEGFFPGCPDLVAEVLSPSDSVLSVSSKMAEYFANGARLAWVLNPREGVALVYRGPVARELIPPEGALDGEDLLPGLKLPLAEVLGEEGV